MSLALRLLQLPVPWRPEQNDRGLAPVARAHQWWSSISLPCGNDTVLNYPPLVCDLLLHLRIQGTWLCSQTARRSVLRNGARRTRRNSGTNGGRGTAACGCNTGALIPDSAAIVFQCIWCSFAALCFVQQAASPPFAWRQPFGSVRAFTHCTCSANKSLYLIPSIGPKYHPCSNCESKGPTRRLEGCKGIHQTRSPNCAKEGTARHPTFLSCAVLPSRPTENRRCMLVAYDTSHVNRSWSAGTSTPVS